MLEARRRPRQADRGVPRPGNARPVAVETDPDTSGGSSGAPFVSRIFPHRQGAHARATPRSAAEAVRRRSACSPLLGALSESLRDHSPAGDTHRRWRRPWRPPA